MAHDSSTSRRAAASSSSSIDGGATLSPAAEAEAAAAVIPNDDDYIARIIKLVNEPNNNNSNRRSLRTSTNWSFGTRSSMEEIPHFSESNSLPIEPILLRHLVNGNKEELLALEVNLWELKSPADNSSVLHIAAANSSHAKLISDILPVSKDIIKWKNSKGDLAFHSAAKAGNLECLKALTDWVNYDSGEKDVNAKLLGIGNNEGNTPLHIGLENSQEEIAWYLVNQHAEACYQLSKKMVSPLYLAVKAGYWDLVKRMIALTMERKEDAQDALLRGKSVVRAAIDAQNSEILTEILENFGNLTGAYDEYGRTPLSYAAFKGYLKGVQYLLKEFPDSAYKWDKDEEGSFPIHMAASGGHIKVIKALHSTKLLRNRKGQNILHVAAGSGKSDAVSYMLKVQELERLINMKDEDGNTPLHLATFGFQPRVVYILTQQRRVKLEVKNKDGLTALDVAEIHAGSNPTFEARLTWMALRYIDAPQSSQSTRKSYVQRKEEEEEERYQKTGQRKQRKKENGKRQLDSYKDRIDTLLLVATLVATVTFAAGFTLPGGYKQDGPQIGMTVLAHTWAFQVFVICNTAAMYSSILAVVTLIWAHMGDLKLVLVSLRFALPVLGFSLAMMSLAFMMGVHVVLSNQPWLSYVVLGIGSIFLAVVLIFFIPLYNPSYIRNPVVRFFFSGTFLLLLIVCERSYSYCA